MFAMGGNAQAVISGLADGRQAQKIIAEALARQSRFGVSTVGGALLPPTPPGSSSIRRWTSLTNTRTAGSGIGSGDAWSWPCSRTVSAATPWKNSWRSSGRTSPTRGFYEWDTREGSGRGSDYYGGSAGSLARALYEGYFGIRLSENGLDLAPKLGADSALVHVYFPAADIFAAYDYQPDRPAARSSSGSTAMTPARAWSRC